MRLRRHQTRRLRVANGGLVQFTRALVDQRLQTRVLRLQLFAKRISLGYGFGFPAARAANRLTRVFLRLLHRPFHALIFAHGAMGYRARVQLGIREGDGELVVHALDFGGVLLL